MKNIYDIIAEQKAIVDVNISSYDLDYTIKQFINHQEYIQEGFGESVKKMVDGFIKFIKSLIQKLREFIRKVFGFFKSSDDKVASMEKQIEDANKKYDEAVKKNKDDREAKNQEIKEKMKKQKDEFEKSEKERKERYKKEDEQRRKEYDEFLNRNARKEEEDTGDGISFDLGTKINDLESVLRQYNRKVHVSYDCGPLDFRIKVVEILVRSFDIVISQPFGTMGEMNGSFLTRKFKDKVFDDEDIKDYKSELQALLYDSEDKVVEVGRNAKTIVAYLNNKNSFLETVSKAEKYVSNHLEKLIKKVQEVATDETVARLFINEYQNLSTLVSSMLNFICVTTMRGYDEYVRLAQMATNDYVRSLAKASGKYYPDED
jgi:hypothetical protein